MFPHRCTLLLGLVLASVPLGCAANDSASTSSQPRVVKILPGPDVQKEAQTALINAQPGDTIEFGSGTFEFTLSLSLAVENVTLRGQGMDQTILSFKKQDAGKEGLLVSRGKFRIEDLTVEDTKGDAIKVTGADGVTFRRVRTRWAGGEHDTNGAYGIYPVQCQNVLVEECTAEGASDAGIYVGQSQNVIVRKCRAERNVAGIEIENCIDADVYDNTTTHNAGGLLVFDLPGLEVKNGKRIRVFKNEIVANDHANFASKGTMVATVAPGTGLVILASRQVEAFQNHIQDNQTHSILIISFNITGRPIEDKEYDPIPDALYIHDNQITGGGTNPQGDWSPMLTALLGKPLPDMIYDGVRPPKASRPPAIYFKNNGKATFANLHWPQLNPMDPMGSRKKVSRDLKSFEGELPALPPVQLSGGL
jgi:parallel beta-helix repeat protein